MSKFEQWIIGAFILFIVGGMSYEIGRASNFTVIEQVKCEHNLSFDEYTEGLMDGIDWTMINN